MATPTAPTALRIRIPADAGLTWGAGVAALVLALVWLVGCYGSTASAMVAIWARSDTFMHGFLIAPISLWLILRRRDELASLVPRPDYRVLAAVAGAGCAWLVGEIAAVDALSQFAFVAMLVLAVPALLGVAVARRIAFPLAFLFFMVPFGEFLLPPLMEGTASVTVAALRLSGVPVYREGLQFVIPSGRWSVVEACSGVRYLIASVVAGSLFAYLSYRTTRRRIAFIAVSIVVPIVANWARAYLIVLLGHLSNNTIAVGVDHLIYGWLFFGVVLFLLFWAGARWREPDLVVAEQTVSRPASGQRQGFALAAPALVAFAIVTALAPLAERALQQRGAQMPSLPGIAVPAAWSPRAGRITDWEPRFVAPSAGGTATFESGRDTVELDVLYYRPAADGSRLVSSENVLVKSEDPNWTAMGSSIVAPNVAPAPQTVRETLLKRLDGTRVLVWQWYWVDGRTTPSDVLAKLYALRARLTGRSDDGAAIIVSAPVSANSGGRSALARFVADAAPTIEDALRVTRDGR